MGLKHSVPGSFKYAFTGLKDALKKEPNFRIHLIIATLTVSAAIFLRFNPLEWIALIITIAFVLVSELFNTILENIVDIVSPEVKVEARVAKDVSAAVVLISAVTAVIVGILLFLPKIISLVDH